MKSHPKNATCPKGDHMRKFDNGRYLWLLDQHASGKCPTGWSSCRCETASELRRDFDQYAAKIQTYRKKSQRQGQESADLTAYIAVLSAVEGNDAK